MKKVLLSVLVGAMLFTLTPLSPIIGKPEKVELIEHDPMKDKLIPLPTDPTIFYE